MWLFVQLRGVTTYSPSDNPCSEGGFFNAILSFPTDYPNSPPTCRFTSEMWHPNGMQDYSKLVSEMTMVI